MPDIKFSNQYPYTDFHELNLDWVISQVKYWSTKVGKTIQSIELTGTVGLVDTYTINYSDGTTSTFDVTNGAGIASITKTGTVGLVDTYTITLQNGSTSTFEVTNGTAAIDPTLTLSDYAADAAATGEAIGVLKSELNYEQQRLGDYIEGSYVHPIELSRGTINTVTGADQANNYRVRTNKIYFDDFDFIQCDLLPGYSLYWFAYDAADNVVGKNGWNNYNGAIRLDKTLYAGAVYARLIFQIENQSTTVLPIPTAYQFRIFSKINSQTIKTECYVSPSGSDSNPGTKASPFATIQTAINNGFKNICVMAGNYDQSLSVANVDGLNIYADNSDAYVSYVKRPHPVFSNGKSFTTFQTDGSGYKYFALTDVPSTYTAVFITHTQQPIITGNYPSYRAGLWANHSDKYNDFRVKPVLTYVELTENNTFYFDGTNVYFNISDTLTGVTVTYATSYNFDFVNCNGLSINGIEILYADSTNLRIQKSNNVTVSNCYFGYTMRSNCVTTDYSNTTFTNCESFKATIDGFNCHYYGVSVYNNCRGVYNYDDGESSHEYCEIIVNGGEYAYNGKSGHGPVNGCAFKCDGTYTHHNSYGFYMVGSASFDTSDILISNSISRNNSTYDLQNTIYNTNLWNNTIGTQHISSGTVTDLTA